MSWVRWEPNIFWQIPIWPTHSMRELYEKTVYSNLHTNKTRKMLTFCQITFPFFNKAKKIILLVRTILGMRKWDGWFQPFLVWESETVGSNHSWYEKVRRLVPTILGMRKWDLWFQPFLVWKSPERIGFPVKICIIRKEHISGKNWMPTFPLWSRVEQRECRATEHSALKVVLAWPPSRWQ